MSASVANWLSSTTGDASDASMVTRPTLVGVINAAINEPYCGAPGRWLIARIWVPARSIVTTMPGAVGSTAFGVNSSVIANAGWSCRPAPIPGVSIPLASISAGVRIAPAHNTTRSATCSSPAPVVTPRTDRASTIRRATGESSITFRFGRSRTGRT